MVRKAWRIYDNTLVIQLINIVLIEFWWEFSFDSQHFFLKIKNWLFHLILLPRGIYIFHVRFNWPKKLYPSSFNCSMYRTSIAQPHQGKKKRRKAADSTNRTLLWFVWTRCLATPERQIWVHFWRVWVQVSNFGPLPLISLAADQKPTWLSLNTVVKCARLHITTNICSRSAGQTLFFLYLLISNIPHLRLVFKNHQIPFGQ